MLVVSKEGHFEAAHNLPLYHGKCKDLHGHSYIVKIEMGFDDQVPTDENGIVVDFGLVKGVIDHYDHKYLNECPPFDHNYPPSAENIIVALSDLLLTRLTRKPRYLNLELHEGLGGNVVRYHKDFLG